MYVIKTVTEPGDIALTASELKTLDDIFQSFLKATEKDPLQQMYDGLDDHDTYGVRSFRYSHAKRICWGIAETHLIRNNPTLSVYLDTKTFRDAFTQNRTSSLPSGRQVTSDVDRIPILVAFHRSLTGQDQPWTFYHHATNQVEIVSRSSNNAHVSVSFGPEVIDSDLKVDP